MKLIECREFEEVNLDISELMEKGEVVLHPDTARRGYFDIDFRGGRLVLVARGWVGQIPLNQSVVLDVRPRFPVSRLLYFLAKSGVIPPALHRLMRRYEVGSDQTATSLYEAAFKQALPDLGRHGMLKTYERCESDLDRRGRLDLTRSVGRFWSKGIRSKGLFQRFDLTTNNAANRSLKLAVDSIFRREHSELTGYADAESEAVRHLLDLLAGIPHEPIAATLLLQRVGSMVRAVPRSHRFYEPLLWLTFLMFAGKEVEFFSEGIAKFQSIVVNMADVFEKYVRQIVRGEKSQFGTDVTVLDGNERPVPLFVNQECDAKPDLYIVKKTTPLLVVDMKYKRTVDAGDKHQLLAFCQALGLKRGVFILPKVHQAVAVEHMGTTAFGTELHVLRFDLGAADLAKEERDLVCRLLSLMPAAVPS